MNELKIKTIKSLKWSLLTEIFTKAIQPVTVLILARLLMPEDFGLIGIAMIFIGLAQIFQDFGLGKTVIQRETELEKTANIVFWSSLFLGTIIFILIIILAPVLSMLFRDERIKDVVRVLSIQIILMSLITVHQALFQRNFLFKHLFLIRLITGVLPALIAIPIAYLGYGVWALVAGTLGGSLAQTILFWIFSSWKPKFSYDFQFAKKIYSFSFWVFLEALLSWIILWGDSICLGYFLGTKELGIYRLGVTLVTFIFSLFFNPIIPVAYSAFSRLQSDLSGLKQYFIKSTRFIAIISLPIGLFMASLANPLVILIFGEKWAGLEIVIAFIALKDSFAWLVGINPEVYRAMGRPDVNTKLLIAAVFYYVPVYIVAASYGLLIFCLARLVIALLSMFLHLFVSNKLIGLPYSYIIDCSKKPLLASSSISLLLFLYVSFSYQQINNIFLYSFNLFIAILITVTIYIFLIRMLDKQSFDEIKLFLYGFKER